MTVGVGDWTFGTVSPVVPDGNVRDSFQGWLDDFRVFERSLSATEVLALYEERQEE